MSLYEPVFRSLESSGARYVLVGGLALLLLGHPKVTADADIVIDLEPNAARAALLALCALGLRPRVPVTIEEFIDPVVRGALVRERGMTVYSLWDPYVPLRQVDIFSEHLIDFAELHARASVVQLLTTNVRVASLRDLLTLKRLAGRDSDAADLELLEALNQRALGSDSE